MKNSIMRDFMQSTGPSPEKSKENVWSGTQSTPDRLPAATDTPEEKKSGFAGFKQSFQAKMPHWVRENSGRINQLGLMAGTAVIMGSVWRNRTISRDMFNAQKDILKANGFADPIALEKKVAELIDSKVMKKPGLHRQRMIYLPTAITGLGIGGFIKDKETPEDRETYKHMSLPQYMGMRLKQSLDPMHHSRQTAGVVGAASGVAAIVSALSQPGGALISEAFVGATLISGFTGLTFFNDPATAKKALNICWASRLPFVVTGTYETLEPPPRYTTPLPELKKLEPEYFAGVAKAKAEGFKIPRFGLGMGQYALAGRKLLTGEKAVEAFTKSHLSLPLPYKRRDWSYPIGQWFNMGMATFGFLMAGSDARDKSAPVVYANNIVSPPNTPVVASHKTENPQVVAANTPTLTVNAAITESRLVDPAKYQRQVAA